MLRKTLTICSLLTWGMQQSACLSFLSTGITGVCCKPHPLWTYFWCVVDLTQALRILHQATDSVFLIFLLLCSCESFACEDYWEDRRWLNMAVLSYLTDCLWPDWPATSEVTINSLHDQLQTAPPSAPQRQFCILTLSYPWHYLLTYTYSLGNTKFH